MAITTYAELKTAINSWMERDFTDPQLAEFVAQAEPRLNRLLNTVETSTALTGVVGSRELDISSVQIDRPKQLFFVDDGDDESELTPTSYANLDLVDTSGGPRYWAVKANSAIVLDRPCDEAYSFRLVYDQKFALSDSATTNWLLDNHPDVYLAACLVWGNAYNEGLQSAGTWKSLLDESIPEVRHELASFRRALLTTDPALQDIGNRRHQYGDFT